MNKKVLFFTHYTDLYGANKSLLNFLIYAKSHIEPVVVTPRYGLINKELKKRNIKSYVCKFDIAFVKYNIRFAFVHFLKRFTAYIRLFKLVMNLKPDIIYTNSSAIEYGVIIAKLFRLPHIWHIREFGLDDFNVKHDFGKRLLTFFLNCSTVNLAISEIIRNTVLKDSLNSTVIYDGVILRDNIAHNSRELVKSKPIIFAIIGLLFENKGQEEAIEAFSFFRKKNKNSVLWVIGNGDPSYEDKLKEIVCRLDLEGKVVFKGFVKNINNEYNNIDILLMCSKSEGLGMVTVEAMSHGIPVIGRNSGATPEIIQDELNGMLYKQGCSELAEKMINLVENKTLYQKLSKNAINTVKENFTIEKYTESIHRVIQKLDV